MSQGEMALLFAILMSLTPLIVAFLDGADEFLNRATNNQKGGKASKKSGRPNLKAVKINADAA